MPAWGHSAWFLHSPGASWVVAGCQLLVRLLLCLVFALGVEDVDQTLLATQWKLDWNRGAGGGVSVPTDLSPQWDPEFFLLAAFRVLKIFWNAFW